MERVLTSETKNPSRPGREGFFRQSSPEDLGYTLHARTSAEPPRRPNDRSAMFLVQTVIETALRLERYSK
jgi:hypothetical protein